MKAAIVLALISSVLAAPPIRQMQRPDHDQYSHIFAQVRPAGQKPQNMELQFQQQQQQQHVVKGDLPQLPVEEHHQYQQSSVQELELVDVQMRPVDHKPQHVVELEVKPVEHKPQHVVEVEIKQQRPNSSPNHVVELEVKPVEHKPEHVVELEVKPVEHKPQHVVEVEIKQQRPEHQRPQHVEFEIKEKQQQHQHYENSAQGHLVSLAAKPVEQKPQHLEFDMPADQHLELEIIQDNSQNGKHMMSGPQVQHLNLSQRQ